MEFLIFATLGLCALALLWLFRRPQVSLATTAPEHAPVPASATRRITSPRRAGRPDVKVWVLRASAGCDLTRSLLDGHRYATDDAPALPGVGCNLIDCHCRYEPLGDTRRNERRERDERRGEFRFEARTERRRHVDRRQTNGWQHASLN